MGVGGGYGNNGVGSGIGNNTGPCQPGFVLVGSVDSTYFTCVHASNVTNDQALLYGDEPLDTSRRSDRPDNPSFYDL